MNVRPTALAALIDSATQELEAALARGDVHFGQGTLNARDEAAWLVLWSLGLPLETDPDAHGAPIAADAQSRALELVRRRWQTRTPAAYLTGEAWLQGVSFEVDPRVIIPRSLIAELLADGSIDPWLHPQTERVLDLCTGNGSLAVLAALTYPEVSVWALDLSTDALDVAARNVARHHLQDRITLLASDGLSQAPGRFDCILCNPPYVNAQSMENLPPEFQAEPRLALDGGVDGMDFIRRLLHDLPQHLSPQGVLVLEIGHERAHFEAAFPQLCPVWLPCSAGDDHVLLLTAQDLGA